MSHFTSVRTKIKDQEALVEVLEAMGYTVESHTQAVRLNSYWERTHYARNDAPRFSEVVIRNFTQASGGGVDIGWQRQPDGTFALIGDQMYAEVRELAKKLPARYGLTVVQKTAIAQGDKFEVKENPDGSYTVLVTPKPPAATRVGQGQAAASKQQLRVRR